MITDFVTADIRLWGNAAVLKGLEAHHSSSGKAKIVGCWEVEVGTLSRLYLLRSFESHAEMASDHASEAISGNPLGVSEHLVGLSIEAYQPWSFVPVPEAGRYGALYELRQYQLSPVGLSPTLAAWESFLPARQAISPVLFGMHALDGPTRILHIVAFASLEERSNLRRKLYVEGLWPPKGAPEQIIEAKSSIMTATAISPMQ